MKVINVENLILGRAASVIAHQLLKEVKTGEEVAVVNAEKAIISGSREKIINEYKDRRTLNHPRKGPFFPRYPDQILKRTIRGMLPYQTPRGRKALKACKTYIGIPSQLAEEELVSLPAAEKPLPVKYLTLGELSECLGASFNR